MIYPHSLNFVAILVSAVILWLLGAIWYSPVLFAKPWMEMLGIKKGEGKQSGLAVGMVASFIGDLVLAFVLAHIVAWAHATGFKYGCVLGVLAWMGFFAAPNLAQGIYEGRPFKLFAINNGYWLAFAPSFATTGVYRDFPLGAEKTEHDRVHGVTFADLVSDDQGLLIIHSGCQYFRKEADGTWSNLIMREWESYFSDEYGFPNYAELAHSLLAHGPEMDNAERTRAAMEFDSKLLSTVSTASTGSLPAKKSFVRVTPENVVLSAFRKRPDSGYELRLLETAGKAATAKVELGFPYTHAVETDLHGRATGQPLGGREITVPMKPWQFRTLQII